jgi:hypothetical protein
LGGKKTNEINQQNLNVSCLSFRRRNEWYAIYLKHFQEQTWWYHKLICTWKVRLIELRNVMITMHRVLIEKFALALTINFTFKNLVIMFCAC